MRTRPYALIILLGVALATASAAVLTTAALAECRDPDGNVVPCDKESRTTRATATEPPTATALPTPTEPPTPTAVAAACVTPVNLVGNTDPTDTSGNTGVLGAASLIVAKKPNAREMIDKLTVVGKWMRQAGAIIAVVLDPYSRWWMEDGSAAIENMLIASTALGYGSCWVEGDALPLEEEFKTLLFVPKGKRLLALIPIGVPEEWPTIEKRPLESVLHWQVY